MTRPATALAPLIPLLTAALPLAAGLALLRSALTGLSVYLGQVQDVSPQLLGGLVLVVFLCGLAAPAVRTTLGPRRAFAALAAALALLRLAAQFAEAPGAQLTIALFGVVLWLWLLPLVIGGSYAARATRGRAPPIIALLIGLALDTALKGAFGTLDLHAAPGLIPQLTAAALSMLQIGLLLPLIRGSAAADAAGALPAAAFAVGPLLALQLLIFQNIARHTVLIGWTQPAAFAWVLAANLAAIAIAIELTRRRTALPRSVLLASAALLIGSAAPGLPPAAAALSALLGPCAAALLLTQALRAAGARSGEAALGLGMLAVPLVLFGWYAHYEIELPFPQAAIPLLAALLAAFGAFGGAAERVGRSTPPPRALLLPLLLLFLLPLHQVARWSTPPAPAGGSAYPIRAATYNIHQGFDLYGRHDLEALARTIEATRADIAALQEVPRGWVVNGSVDVLSWLAQRLEMHAAWGPAADPLWGNAILSRYPIVRAGNAAMPNSDALLFKRAYLSAVVELGGERIPRLQIVATHLHHIGREREHRRAQIEALLSGVDWSRPTILLGDLNARPQSAELQLLLQAGLHTVPRPIFTFPAQRPRRQIDHIFITEHFTISAAAAVPSTASDHLPLSAVIEVRP